MVVNLQDFASRETGSEDPSFWSSEPEVPITAPVPHVNTGLVDEIQPLIADENKEIRKSDGFNLVSKYRKTEGTLEVLTEEEGDRRESLRRSLVAKSGVVRHGVKSFDLVHASLHKLDRLRKPGASR